MYGRYDLLAVSALSPVYGERAHSFFPRIRKQLQEVIPSLFQEYRIDILARGQKHDLYLSAFLLPASAHLFPGLVSIWPHAYAIETRKMKWPVVTP